MKRFLEFPIAVIHLIVHKIDYNEVFSSKISTLVMIVIVIVVGIGSKSKVRVSCPLKCGSSDVQKASQVGGLCVTISNLAR